MINIRDYQTTRVSLYHKNVSMSAILDDLSWRYATKKFDATKKLSQEQIHLIKKGFNLTASSYGLQPVRLLIISNQELKEQLVASAMNQQQVADASHLLVFCIEKNIDTTYVKKYFDRVKTIRATANDVLQPFQDFLTGHFSSLSSEDIRLWATKQAYLAMGNLLTVCAVEKIDACPMEGFVPQEFDVVLDLEEKGLQSVLIMPVGFRDNDDEFASFKKVRKSLEEAIFEL